MCMMHYVRSVHENAREDMWEGQRTIRVCSLLPQVLEIKLTSLGLATLSARETYYIVSHIVWAGFEQLCSPGM